MLSAMAFLPAAALALRLLPLPHVLGLVDALATPRRRPAEPGVALRAGHLVMLASRCCLPRPTCLAKALVAYGFLRRRGLAVEIVIGVTRDADSLLAHAWVEHGGRPAAGRPAARAYAPLVRLGDGRMG
ncbi:MAG: lasso peptide biosynthesis B2 protein [Candidatus Rokubacteria bacterium]|nr:lasso peptide biosynthesis B2 protein [Candidatus Rokubacteria bacterium]